MTNFLDKRQFYRHPVSVPIEFQASQHRPQRTTSVDLSEGGICFLAERSLAKGVSISLKIPVGNHIYSMDGQVAYSNRVPSLNRFKTGVSFNDPDTAFRARLVEEMLQVKIYQKKLSEESGYQVTEEEAARRWVEKYAKHFPHLF